ncbi:MAG: 50S ribosomal protein L1 [Elusimicrobiota bacterium]
MSKRLAELNKLVEKTKYYHLAEAVQLLKQTAKAKFDETVEIALRLGVDPKQSDQNVRGTIVLPSGLGKSKKVLVIAKGEKLKEAETSGAEYFGGEELIEKISKGWMDFDVIVATPDIMRDLSKLGKILGPRGLMPNPKTGTVTFEIAKAVKEIKTGKIEFKVDSTGIIHCGIGKASFTAEKIAENAQALIEAVLKAKAPTVKGQYLKSITISTTMGPGIKLDINQKFD